MSGHADFRGRILESYSAMRVSTLCVDDHSVILQLCFTACKVWSLFLKDAVKLMWSCMWTSPELLTRVTLRCLSFSCVTEDYQKDVVLSTLTAVIRPVSYSPSQMSILLASVPDWADRGATLTWLVWKLILEHAGSMQAGLRSSCVAGVEIFLPHSKVSWD